MRANERLNAQKSDTWPLQNSMRARNAAHHLDKQQQNMYIYEASNYVVALLPPYINHAS